MKILSDQRPFVINVSIDFDFDPSSEAAEILKKYGKSSDGRYFSRDILVPGDITLAALHFVIQNAFGFKNSHMKRFYLDDDLFLKVTNGGIKGYKKLLGVLFRLLYLEDPDQFWNDRYFNFSNDDSYFGRWMKNKCKGPYCYAGQGEYPEVLNEKYKNLATYYKKITGDTFLEAKFNENSCIPDMLEYDFNDLLSRLPLRKVLGTKKEIKNVADKINVFLDKYTEKFPTLTSPVADKINYCYDYGDEWNFVITKRDDIEISDSDYRKVLETYTPIALKADGINLIDDVGGIYGFIEFLYSYFIEKDEEIIEWSGDWVGEVPDLETMF